MSIIVEPEINNLPSVRPSRVTNPTPPRPGTGRVLPDPTRTPAPAKPGSAPQPRPSNVQPGGTRRAQPGDSFRRKVRRPRHNPSPAKRSFPRTGTKFRPNTTPKLKPKPVPTPGVKPQPRPSGNIILAEILLLIAQTAQQRIANKAITDTDLNDGTQRTDEDSPCRTGFQPPCYGFGNWPGDEVNDFFQSGRDRLNDVQLQFAFSALSARVFMRIHNNAVEHYLSLLEDIIQKNSFGQTRQQNVDFIRFRVQETRDCCVREETLPNGTING